MTKTKTEIEMNKRQREKIILKMKMGAPNSKWYSIQSCKFNLCAKLEYCIKNLHIKQSIF